MWKNVPWAACRGPCYVPAILRSWWPDLCSVPGKRKEQPAQELQGKPWLGIQRGHWLLHDVPAGFSVVWTSHRAGQLSPAPHILIVKPCQFCILDIFLFFLFSALPGPWPCSSTVAPTLAEVSPYLSAELLPLVRPLFWPV
jgi:hypothetical protein